MTETIQLAMKSPTIAQPSDPKFWFTASIVDQKPPLSPSFKRAKDALEAPAP